MSDDPVQDYPEIFNLRLTPPPGFEWVIVDRRTPWGNPYKMENDSQAERDRVCKIFETYAEARALQEPDWLKPLRGKNLACWCSPKRCHAETLRRLANS